MQTELIGMTGPLPAEVREGCSKLRGYPAGRRSDRQLLLFSRRQVMQLRLVDLNEVVMNLARMLQRVIREDVRLQLHLHPAPLRTFADAGMLEQVLMNLAVNARDAMPQGGQLLIETTEAVVAAAAALLNSDAAPGRYVCLRVTDTGSGIPPEILPESSSRFSRPRNRAKARAGLATSLASSNNIKAGSSWRTARPGSDLPRLSARQQRPGGGTGLAGGGT